MPNPIFQATQSNGVNQLAQLYQNMVSSNNPIGFIQQMAQTNPQLNGVVSMLQNGASPQQVFYQLARQRGIDPNQFLQMVKGSMR